MLKGQTKAIIVFLSMYCNSLKYVSHSVSIDERVQKINAYAVERNL